MEKLENTENVKEENSVTHSTRMFGLLPFGAVMNSIALTQSLTYLLAHNGTFLRVYTQEQNFWVKLLKFSALLDNVKLFSKMTVPLIIPLTV